MFKTLEERIASMKWTAETDSIFVHTTDPKEDYSSFGAARGRQEQAKEAMKIIEELQAKNQALQKKLDEALAKLNEVENENESLADCVARLLIILHEKGLIKFEVKNDK